MPKPTASDYALASESGVLMERQAAALYFAVLRTQYEAEMTAAKKSATKPLPCPFCGGPAVVIGGNGEGWNVTCEFNAKRSCFMPRAPIGWIEKRKAIAAWNRRAS